MRIGIITLSASKNCGSMLQCYALKEILKKYGEVEVINFSSIASHEMYDIKVPKISNIKHPRSFLESILWLRKQYKEEKGYNYFKKKYLKIKGEEFLSNNLFKISGRYDIVIVGSDQVWNVKMRDFDEAFFGYWTGSKKIAYAVSLGGHDIRESENINEIVEWIKDFSMLSSRENKGKKCIEELTNRSVEKVLDPTLTIDKEKWNNLIGKPLVNKDYIFFYSWAYCYDELIEIVSEQAKKEGLAVYVIDARKWSRRKLKKWGFYMASSEGPLAFLNLMYYAKRCYVESFHGMIFAYLFEKNFWLLDTHEEKKHMDNRLKELVSILGMESRIITPYNFLEVNQKEQIDYKENETLKQLKLKSLEYISEGVG